ncbi:MAG: beta-mannosidase [Bacteroidetes bacterium B1(2017)]|nr:MAG: beta-mannosidase [Bacteroidetes bacterium B1(2017)]
MPAKVPGNLHTDLLLNKKIDDPFLGRYEAKVQWVENENWEYETLLLISKEELSQKHIFLSFENLDTYANIYLNDELIGKANNQFRIWKLDVKNKLHIGSNKLHILFKSSSIVGKELATNLPYTLPGGEAVFTRKAPYQYGWDWGPRLVTCGIDKVSLEFYSDAHFGELKSTQIFEADSIAKVYFELTIFSDTNSSKNLTITCQELGPSKDQNQVLKLKKGENKIPILMTIKSPKRWWSNGLGNANLYHFSFKLVDSKRLLEEKKECIGLRELKLIRTKDSIGNGFYVELNGMPVFMKGANIIPVHSFLNGLPNETYTNLINQCKEANMNMLRVWGGGVYGSDEFYKACDENGILVWQDFMFACAMYPGDSAFLNNVAHEVSDQVIRLRNHPSLAVWCGNNEIDEGWKNWGWQKQYSYSFADSSKIEQDYQTLFNKLIPNLLGSLDPQRYYHASSPTYGWGRKESMYTDDSHYWGVWWGMEPFEKYEKKVGRFMSEYGFQGMPSIHTYEKFMPNFPASFDSLAFKTHQKHPTGYQTIKEYMARDFKVPTNFEDYIYVSQLLQAEGMKTAIEAHRRAMPYCMGTLYWQLNDCWPVSSWSSIDFYNNKKAFYYQSKRSFEPVLISFAKSEKDSLSIYIVSDKTKKLKGTFVYKWMDFNGKVLDSLLKPIEVSSLSSMVYHSWPLNKLKHNSNLAESTFLKVEFRTDTSSYSANYFFAKPKDLKLPDAIVKIDLLNDSTLQVKSASLAKNVAISLTSEELDLEDNFFDLLPNEARIISLKKALTSSQKNKLKVQYLNKANFEDLLKKLPY